MWKWFGRIVTGVSVLLLIATLAVWARAQWVRDVLLITSVDAPSGEVRETTRRLMGERRVLELFIHRLTFVTGDAQGQATLLRDLPREEPVRFRQFLAEPLNGRDFEWRRVDHGPGTSLGRLMREVNGLAYPVGYRDTTVRVPWWCLSLVFALAPMGSLWRWGTRRRMAPHCCPSCGYDLRATGDPAGPRWATCPECGRAADGRSTRPRSGRSA
jgi:hypothetical protein